VADLKQEVTREESMLGGLGACLLLTSVLAAQAVTAQAVTAQVDKSSRFERLSASYDLAKAEYTAKRTAITKTDEYKELRKARDYGAIRKLMAEIQSPDADFYPRFEKLAKASEGSPMEIRALLWMLGHTRDKAKNATTIETLAARDIRGAFWAARLRALPYYLGAEKGGALLKRLSKEHADEDVRLMARYNLNQALLRDKASDDEAREAAKADLADLIAQNPESIPALAKKAPEFMKTRLKIGMKAPDIVGKDVDGNDIKLSDYLGRVVVIDFWGDW